ncbi:Nuclear pore complex protein Nup214, partial [Stegodyphus mimosarum]
MLEEAPVALKEVSNFHFCQLRTLRVVKGNEKVPKKNINLIATASKYGLIFIGIENGFKILKLENILDLDEDKENKNIEENYFSQFVKSESPSLLALSADQKTLAVCISNNTHVVADMYDIAAFADPEGTPTPFLNVQLSTSDAELKEFIWNPVIDGMYAFCLTDGSLYVHELNGTVLKIFASEAQAAATAACWSPKGKQLVVGKKDGSFTQYKPTLQEVKTVSAPPLQEGEIRVANICWISTTLFALLYVPDGENVSPSLIMASTPKGAPVAYTNFCDVCLGNATSSDQRYFMHYESAW